MPIHPVTREPLPYVRPAYEPDTRTLRELMAMAGQARANNVGRKGEARAQALMTLGQVLSQGLRGIREGGEREQAMRMAASRQAQEDAFQVRDQQLREADLMARVQEREQARADKAEADAYRRGGEVAEEVGYGPMSEMQLDAVMQGPAAGRARYSFGPGTAEGPELQPTRQQQRGMDVEKSINAMGGQIGPNGQVVMPPKPETVNLKVEDVLLDGRPAKVVFNPVSGKFQQNGVDVTARVRPIPPQGPTGGEPLEAVIGPDGNAILVPRSQARGMRPATTREQPTEDERKSAGFYRQMQESIAIIDELENQLSEKDLAQIQLPQEMLLGALNRGEMSEAAKRYLRAFEQFTEARMRPVSGAAISDSEFARDRRTYARQFSETPALAKDRKAARASALDTLRVRSARALPKDAPTGRVKMQAPDGSVQEVDASMVDHYKSRGAKVVQR